MKIECYTNLVQVLEEEITVYRHFLDLVRHEHEILVDSQLEKLLENNRAKEAMIIKLKNLERIREKRARELAQVIGIKADPVKLLDLASNIDLQYGDKLRTIHSTLELLIKRVKENNQKNEVLVQSALTNIKGALENLKQTLTTEKPTYKNEGKMEDKAPQGRFVSREA